METVVFDNPKPPTMYVDFYSQNLYFIVTFNVTSSQHLVTENLRKKSDSHENIFFCLLSLCPCFYPTSLEVGTSGFPRPQGELFFVTRLSYSTPGQRYPLFFTCRGLLLNPVNL